MVDIVAWTVIFSLVDLTLAINVRKKTKLDNFLDVDQSCRNSGAVC